MWIRVELGPFVKGHLRPLRLVRLQEMASMNVTNLLLVTILLILIRQYYPSVANVLVPVTLGALFIFGLAQLIVVHGRRKAKRMLEEYDETCFREHREAHDALRKKYDPRNEWNEATSVPPEYLSEVKELNSRYREMLIRRNGWTEKDFDD